MFPAILCFVLVMKREREGSLDYQFTVKWSGKEFQVSLPGNQTVEDLKIYLFSLTNVRPMNQKITGLWKGKAPNDSVSYLLLF